MKEKVIFCSVLLLNLGQLLASYYATPESLKYIGPHNLHKHFLHLQETSAAKSVRTDILGEIESNYQIKPIKRDLLNADLSNQELFSAIIKREVAWSYPQLNEFGLFTCDQDLKFSIPVGPAVQIELIPGGRKIFIQKFDDVKVYERESEKAKDLQTQCLIKALEKSTGSSRNPLNCNKGIPFCFSDSWKQIWWKVPETQTQQKQQQQQQKATNTLIN